MGAIKWSEGGEIIQATARVEDITQNQLISDREKILPRMLFVRNKENF